ncbi:MAG TPA: ABC transporter permease [Usitatibacter sp.]|jgi:cell division transport system permease protein|nr:ABC transporter permease [Usitatibacter sp.]
MTVWLRLHALALADAAGRLARQPFASGFSILVLAMALALPVLAAVALRSAGAVASRVDTDPHVNVFLALDATDEEAKRVGQALRSQPSVSSVRFVPRAQAFDELRTTTHLAELLASLDHNPLPDAYTVRVATSDPAALAALRDTWSRLPKVDRVVADGEWAARLAGWIGFGRTVTLLGGGFLALAIAFMVAHLIRLQVATRRDEVEVSRLVGATNWDVRRPFLYFGLLEGALAGLLAVGFVQALALWTQGQMQVLAPVYGVELQAFSVALPEAGVIVASAALLGWIGARIAVGLELKGLAGRR